MSRIGNLFGKFRANRPAERDEPPEQRGEARWLIAGLGNPGEQYTRSRHNVGFTVVKRIVARGGGELNRRKFNGLFAEVRDGDGAVIIVAPQTFYNRSGECVAGMLGYFKIPPQRLIVIHDDMDLPAGQLRIKRGGGDAGNRGVRSIAETLATPDFIRVRVGIGHPGEAATGAVTHVLKPLSDNEIRSFEAVFDRAADAVFAIMRDGLERAMNLYNQRV